jgi:hypothetical protein
MFARAAGRGGAVQTVVSDIPGIGKAVLETLSLQPTVHAVQVKTACARRAGESDASNGSCITALV